MSRPAIVVITTALLWSTSLVQRVELGALVGGSSLLADFGLTAAGAGVLLGIYFPLCGIAQIPAGVVADLAHPRRLLVLAGLASAVTTLFLAVAPNVPLAMAARGAMGVTSGFMWLSSLKLLSLLPAVRYGRAVNVLSAFGASGTILGLSLIPLAASTWSWRWAVVASAVPCVLVSLILAVLPLPGAGAAAGRRSVRRGRGRLTSGPYSRAGRAGRSGCRRSRGRAPPPRSSRGCRGSVGTRSPFPQRRLGCCPR